MLKRVFCLIWGSLALLPVRVYAQGERFELGERLRAFEAVWQQQSDPKLRERAIAPLQQATNTFLFKPRLGESGLGLVAQALDQARYALNAEAPPAHVLWAESLYCLPNSRLIDLAAPELPVTLVPLYKVEAELPKGARLRLLLLDRRKKEPRATAETAIDKLPLQAALPLKDMSEGDYAFRAEILVDGTLGAAHEQIVSCVARLSRRLEALQHAAASFTEADSDTQKQTVRGLAGLLEQLAKKEKLETNFPAGRLLTEAESAAGALVAGKPFYGQRKTGDFRLWLAVNGKPVPSRLAIPEEAAKGKPLPLVVVIHGTGGSENMFFDGHGPGLLVRLCQERGWLLVAPRSAVLGPPDIAGVIAEVAKLYPVDRQRVFLLGHSIGAVHAVGVGSTAPEQYAGVAALAGGGLVRPAAALKKLPFFIAVGKEDALTLRSTRLLHDKLKEAEVAQLDYREYERVEHITIVVEALPDAFKFFDKVGGR